MPPSHPEDMQAPGAGIEPTFAGSGPAVLPLDDPGMQWPRRDSNPHAAKATAFETAASTDCATRPSVARRGFDPLWPACKTGDLARSRTGLRVSRAGVEPAQRLRVGYSHLGSPMPSRLDGITLDGIRAHALHRERVTTTPGWSARVSQWLRWELNPQYPAV